MTNSRIQDSEQDLIDVWVSVVHGASTPPKKSWDNFVELILDRDDDIYNSAWLGFYDLTHIGTAVHLQSLIENFLDWNGGLGDTNSRGPEIIAQFRNDLEGEMERGPGFFSREIRSREGQSATLGFRQDDAGGVFVAGVFKTPLTFEQALRKKGWIFPFETPPSGAKDHLSDERILELLRKAGGEPFTRN